MNAMLPRSESSRQVWLLFGVASVCIAASLNATRLYVMDDALITLRYSLNFARYGRPVWNHADLSHPGSGYAYTSVLWMLTNTLPALLTRDRDLLVAISRLILLLPLALIVLIMVSRIGRMAVALSDRVVVTVALFSLALYGFHLNSAMETLAFCCLVLLTVVAYSPQRQGGIAYLFATLAFLTRPEGALLCLLIGFQDIRSGNLRRAVAGIAGLVLTALALGLIMKLAYGHALPNSFYVKQRHALSAWSLTMTGEFLLTVALPFIPLAMLSVYRIKDPAAALAWSAALLFLGYYLTVQPIMNHFYRFQMPALILLTYASLPAIERILTRIRSKARPQWRAAAAGLLLLAVLCDVTALRQTISWSGQYGTVMSNFIALGKAIRRGAVDERWLVFDWAGAVPYYSDWDTCDMYGLTDLRFSSGKSGKSALEDLVRDPHCELVILIGWFFKAFPAQDTEHQLAEIRFPGTVRFPELNAPLREYEVVEHLPVMIDGTTQYCVVRVLARHPDRVRSLLTGMKLAPQCPRILIGDTAPATFAR